MELTDSNYLQILQEIYDKPSSLPLLINLILGECSSISCRRIMEENNELSKVVKNQNRVAMVDCAYEKQVC